MITKEKMEEIIKKFPDATDVERAKIAGINYWSWIKYKGNYKLTKAIGDNVVMDEKGKVLERLNNGILNIQEFSEESKMDRNKVYKLIDELEQEGKIIEKSQSGYYINRVSVSPRNLIHTYYKNKLKIAAIGDTHLCSTEQQLTYLNTFYDICEREKVEVVFHCGDINDGENVFKGHKYNVFAIGADKQVQYTIDNYPLRKNIKTYLISGNHDLDYHKTNGIDIVKSISDKRKDIVYMGQLGAYVKFGENTKAYLYHPDGGGSYALSYKIQRFIEKLSPENKPNICFFGHYHQAEFLVVRNVFCLQVGCFQSQTDFLKRKGLEPQIGGWIIDLNIDEKTGSINRIKPEWINFFSPVYHDY